jgi:Transposase DDE domain
MNQDTAVVASVQASREVSGVLAHQCYEFLRPLLRDLNRRLDRRLVQTLLDLILVIVIHRHRNQGLVLSELGEHLLGAAHTPAGVKRVANLLHSARWSGALVDNFLWAQADHHVQELQGTEQMAYVLWDESVLEKPESLKAERLCAVRSSKAARLKRIKPGYFNPPGGRPICVPGFHWLQIVVVGLRGRLTLAHLHFWTTRGDAACPRLHEEIALLQTLAVRWGRQVVHVWDRGFAGEPWISAALAHHARFIIRWKKGNKLVDAQGMLKKAWEISRGKRSVDHRLIYDCRRRCNRKTGIVFLPVQLPHTPEPLWLVVSRPGQGRLPWYLLTTEPITTPDDAWRSVLAYNRRWQIEMSIRFDKSELAMESPRLRDWSARWKLLLLAALAQAFLLMFLAPLFEAVRQWLLSVWCHRTGQRSRTTATPLYRLRLALSNLWLAFRPQSLPRLNSG